MFSFGSLVNRFQLKFVWLGAKLIFINSCILTGVLNLFYICTQLIAWLGFELIILSFSILRHSQLDMCWQNNALQSKRYLIKYLLYNIHIMGRKELLIDCYESRQPSAFLTSVHNKCSNRLCLSNRKYSFQKKEYKRQMLLKCGEKLELLLIKSKTYKV